MDNTIINHVNHSLEVLVKTKKDIYKIKKISSLIEKKIKNGKSIFVYGNGGSFSDASHFVGELTATYNKKNRKPLPFYLLSSNLASVTAWSNDFNFNDYVSREFLCYSKKGDVLIIFSTSGGSFKKKQSLNLIKLSKIAKKNSNTIITFLGKKGGELKNITSNSIIINSNNTGTIQEMHKIIFHSICAYLDKKF